TIVSVVTLVWGISPRQPSGKNIIRWLLKKEQMVVSAIASTPQLVNQRRHSRLGNISPAAFREKYHQMAA
ncbi:MULTISPECIES: hypothetical protein, partial [unclassified Shigella]|uniref:hypothetical protein n=1 Tax=unclassified Shigella TaxID=2629414 RepID=UPI002729C520